jgi:feruloyl esterase
VLGKTNERVGVDGQRYAIGFHLRLPTQWNGRFLFQGGGGTDGDVGDAIGVVTAGVPTALDRGFAVISTDAGHDNRTNRDPQRQGQVAFGYDYEARVDYAERSLEVVAKLGRALVTAFYGRAPERSYFFGCSNGGRQGMIFAQRFPELFDGIVASAPAFDVPRAAIAEAWDTQAFGTLAQRMGLVDSTGAPLLNRTFSDGDLALVSRAVLDACDALDGLADGIVGDFVGCTTARVAPKLAARTCAGAKGDACLTRDQIETLERVLGGARNAKGEALYADWPWDAGVGAAGWRVWKLGTYDGRGLPFAINVILGSPALSALFVTPPTPVPDDPRAHLAYQMRFSMDTSAPKIYARTSQFPRSSWELVAAKSTDLSAFRRRGGKLIVPHGVSDPVFSVNDTRRWWDAVNAASGGKAAEFVRVFPVPGMNHCNGGPATDRYDCLTALVDWVERGVAPDRIVARAGEGSPWPGRTRPLCPYPQVARYAGAGSVDSASSFVCR